MMVPPLARSALPGGFKGMGNEYGSDRNIYATWQLPGQKTKRE
jgi:hypothetical protein